MSKLWLFIILTVMITFSTCSVLYQLIVQPSMFETTSALQEILNSSTLRARMHLEDFLILGWPLEI